jgi:phosphoethanolamine N-methyltransferase
VYVEISGYDVLRCNEYIDTIEKAGFEMEVYEEITQWSLETMIADLQRFVTRKENFLKDYTNEDYEHIVNRWNTKIDFIERGLLTEGLFIASKT